MKFILAPAFVILAVLYGWSQHTISFDNPSFEDMPQFGRPPMGWISCGFESESPVDIQPGSWQVTQDAYHGATYLGMVVRASGTWEGVSQKIRSPLQPGVLYALDAFLARSPVYLSPASNYSADDSINFDRPVILRLWGGTAPCTYRQLLAQTPPVDHSKWKTYRLTFIPCEKWTHLTLTAFYDPRADNPYYGNILVDYLSDMVPLELKEVNQETLELAVSQIPSHLVSSKSPEATALAMVIMLSDIEQALILEKGFEQLWGNMNKEDILKSVQNLRAAGASAHATILEQWAEMLDDRSTPRQRQTKQLKDLASLWNDIEKRTPLSSIRRKLVLKYRDDIISWIETHLKR